MHSVDNKGRADDYRDKVRTSSAKKRRSSFASDGGHVFYFQSLCAAAICKTRCDGLLMVNSLKKWINWTILKVFQVDLCDYLPLPCSSLCFLIFDIFLFSFFMALASFYGVKFKLVRFVKECGWHERNKNLMNFHRTAVFYSDWRVKHINRLYVILKVSVWTMLQ